MKGRDRGEWNEGKVKTGVVQAAMGFLVVDGVN